MATPRFGAREKRSECSLALRLLGTLHDGVPPQEVFGREVDAEVLRVRLRSRQTVAKREEILPLGIGSWRIGICDRITGGFETVRITDDSDHFVASRDVFFESLDERTGSLLEILLHANFAADGAQVARERVTALLELARDG